MTPADQGWQAEGNSDELLLLSSSTGREFMQRFVETLADCFEADLVTLGELKVQKIQRIAVLNGCFDGQPIAEIESDGWLAPCKDVIAASDCKTFLGAVQDTYPKDAFFIKEGIQSYIGFPLMNAKGNAIGLVQAAWRREIDQEEADHLIETIELFMKRLSAELITLQAVRILSALADRIPAGGAIIRTFQEELVPCDQLVSQLNAFAKSL